MTPQNPQMSPDGAYWWDGQAWQPMPLPGSPVPVAPQPSQVDRPSWLPEAIETPSAPLPASTTSQAPVATQDPIAPPSAFATPVAQMAPPPWMPQTPPASTSRTAVMVAAVAAIALMMAGAGVWAWHQSQAAEARPSQAATPSGAGAPRSSPTVSRPLTAELAGDYCPVAHPGNAACWKGTFVNTGPPIGKLAMIF